MKWQAMLSLVFAAALAAANGEELGPQQLSPSQGAGQLEEPPLPTPEVGSSNPEPGLLPESGEIPDRPRTVASPKLSETPALTRPAATKGDRFEVIQSLAMGDRHATYLLKRAKTSSNPVSRRIYLRAYYTAVASRMRKLDPKLKSSINSYEEGKLHELSEVRNPTRRASSHRSRIHWSARVAAHHRRHRLAEHTWYRRVILMDAPYGPPVFPAYGSPVFFDPW